MADKQDFWSGRVGFVLANIADAVGLGSIWKFPYEVGANGGGTFVVLYIAGLALIVLPLMLAELAIGRSGRSDAVTSVTRVSNWGPCLSTLVAGRPASGHYGVSDSQLLLRHRRMGDRLPDRHGAEWHRARGCRGRKGALRHPARLACAPPLLPFGIHGDDMP